MWDCQYCKVSIKDKYKFCWNCARPRSVAEVIPEPEPEPVAERPPEIIEAPVEFIPPATGPEIAEPLPEEPVKPAYETDFLSGFKPAANERPPSQLAAAIPFVLWTAAFVATGLFTWLSFQKMTSFAETIAEEKRVFNEQKAKYVFPPKPNMRRGTVLEFGNIKTKVLPLNVQTNEVDPLFSTLPDDLRPANDAEVMTVMWLDCKNNEVGRYTDGTAGFQENCTAYLVDKATSKFIGIQDFLGVMPALSKERGGGDAVGKVLHERYIAFLREKQPEPERSAMESAPDSPNHHFFSKSELIYSLLILGFLTAIGLGWVAFKIKYNWDAD